MKLDMAGVLADSWAMWKRDRALLLPIAGIFLFLPLLALLLLVPAMPPIAVTPEMSDVERVAVVKPAAEWLVGYGGWYVLASLVVHAGLLVVFIQYLDDDRPDLGAALARAVRRYPRFLLAMILFGLPLGFGQWFLLFLLPAFYLTGRLLPLGPVLVGEARGIRPSLSRCWSLTRGHGLVMMGLTALTQLVGLIGAVPFMALERSLRTAGAANPVVVTMIDAAAGAITAASLLAMALIQVAAYRRLVSKGI